MRISKAMMEGWNKKNLWESEWQDNWPLRHSNSLHINEEGTGDKRERFWAGEKKIWLFFMLNNMMKKVEGYLELLKEQTN